MLYSIAKSIRADRPYIIWAQDEGTWIVTLAQLRIVVRKLRNAGFERTWQLPFRVS